MIKSNLTRSLVNWDAEQKRKRNEEQQNLIERLLSRSEIHFPRFYHASCIACKHLSDSSLPFQSLDYDYDVPTEETLVDDFKVKEFRSYDVASISDSIKDGNRSLLASLDALSADRTSLFQDTPTSSYAPSPNRPQSSSRPIDSESKMITLKPRINFTTNTINKRIDNKTLVPFLHFDQERLNSALYERLLSAREKSLMATELAAHTGSRNMTYIQRYINHKGAHWSRMPMKPNLNSISSDYVNNSNNSQSSIDFAYKSATSDPSDWSLDETEYQQKKFIKRYKAYNLRIRTDYAKQGKYAQANSSANSGFGGGAALGGEIRSAKKYSTENDSTSQMFNEESKLTLQTEKSATQKSVKFNERIKVKKITQKPKA